MDRNWKRDATLFLVSQMVSLFGTSLVQFAITWYITLKTQSGAMITISIVCGFLPTFFLSPFSGVWADRYHRKALIMLSDSLIAAATLVMAVLFKMGHGALWLLFAVSIIRALGSGVQAPAVGAFLPQIVPEENLMKVNAINGSAQSIIMLISPMVSGALLATTAIENIFLIDVVTAAAAVSILALFLRVPAHAKAMNRQSTAYLADFREGFAYIRNHGYLVRFCLFNIAYLLLVAPVAFLTPLQVTRSFGKDVWRLTAIEIAFSGGMMLGGVIMASWGGFKNKVHSMVLSNAVVGVSTAAMGIAPTFWIYLGFMVVCGMAMPVFSAPAMVLLQQKVEDGFRGRVFGVLGMITSSMMPLGMLIFGPMSDAVKIEWLLIGTGLMMFVLSLLALGNKVMIEAGRPSAS